MSNSPINNQSSKVSFNLSQDATQNSSGRVQVKYGSYQVTLKTYDQDSKPPQAIDNVGLQFGEGAAKADKAKIFYAKMGDKFVALDKRQVKKTMGRRGYRALKKGADSADKVWGKVFKKSAKLAGKHRERFEGGFKAESAENKTKQSEQFQFIQNKIQDAQNHSDLLNATREIRSSHLTPNEQVALFEKLLDKAIQTGNKMFTLRSLVNLDHDLAQKIPKDRQIALLEKAIDISESEVMEFFQGGAGLQFLKGLNLKAGSLGRQDLYDSFNGKLRGEKKPQQQRATNPNPTPEQARERIENWINKLPPERVSEGLRYLRDNPALPQDFANKQFATLVNKMNESSGPGIALEMLYQNWDLYQKVDVQSAVDLLDGIIDPLDGEGADKLPANTKAQVISDLEQIGNTLRSNNRPPDPRIGTMIAFLSIETGAYDAEISTLKGDIAKLEKEGDQKKIDALNFAIKVFDSVASVGNVSDFTYTQAKQALCLIFNLPQDTSDSDLKKRIVFAMRVLHPDKTNSHAAATEAAKLLQQIKGQLES